MQLPHLTHIEEYIQFIDNQYEHGLLKTKDYYVALGKAWAYAETQSALGIISQDEAKSLIDKITWLLIIS